MRRRDLTQAERAEWAAFARHVAPLPEHELPDGPQADAEPPPPATRIEVPLRSPARTPLPPVIRVGDAPGGLDASSWNRLRTGKLAPTRTLDLHGRTVQRAYVALHAFLLAAHADRVRCVEIITGKGSGASGGVIRRELPIWLNQPSLRPLVLAASYPHPGNPGAVRLLLRRSR
ncbi:MAG TPA: Smr/MutS family protein [Acetobacteraceae bacterium]|jgi:DNA-nicking Smr family endonuclease|nr:Smr/MutS family protein [Acetobacteraceae bacterium]